VTGRGRRLLLFSQKLRIRAVQIRMSGALPECRLVRVGRPVEVAGLAIRPGEIQPRRQSPAKKGFLTRGVHVEVVPVVVDGRLQPPLRFQNPPFQQVEAHVRPE
jgi:hypothetical protein